MIGSAVFAQEPRAPLSAIDWLETMPVTPVAPPPAPIEPKVTDTGLAPRVEVVALGPDTQRTTGLVAASVTGLPDTMWQATDGETLAGLIADVDIPHLPAAQALLYSLLLTESQAPQNADAFQAARIDALIRMGALEPALALLRDVRPDTPALFKRYFDLSLIGDDAEDACRRLLATPSLNADPAAEIFCLARAGDWTTAAVLFGTSDALGLLEPARAQALARFLDPDLFEGDPPLPAPQDEDALIFTLQDALGQRPATQRWSLVYAQTDLSERVGWKAQLEAAERLAQTGAIPDNRLLGIFTDRRPSASGGIWDRVEAIQTFETALDTGSTAAVEKTLPAALRAARQGRIAARFASLFADATADHTLLGPAAQAGFDVLLLSGAYQRSLTAYPDEAARRPVITGVVRGDTSGLTGTTPLETAVIDGFSGAAPPLDRPTELGAALLASLLGLEEAYQGNVTTLADDIRRLRRLGQDDTARRAALQLLLRDGQT